MKSTGTDSENLRNIVFGAADDMEHEKHKKILECCQNIVNKNINFYNSFKHISKKLLPLGVNYNYNLIKQQNADISMITTGICIFRIQ